jgi:hypothetical protein
LTLKGLQRVTATRLHFYLALEQRGLDLSSRSDRKQHQLYQQPLNTSLPRESSLPQSVAMSNTCPTLFRFFDLLKKLRLMIYDMLTVVVDNRTSDM